MTKRTLTLNAERLNELTAGDLSAVVGGVAEATKYGNICDTLDQPTVPDINRCPSLFC